VKIGYFNKYFYKVL